MLINCITSLPTVQEADSMCVAIDQSSEFTHFSTMSLEYGTAQRTELSNGEMFRVHEQFKVITSDQDQGCWEWGAGAGSADFQKSPGEGAFREHFLYNT
jgi:hypothetical protein